jgi:hypothetical protein
MLATVLLAFPTNAFAYWGEGLVDKIKETGGEILDFGGGVLEVGWEGVYGAGCGVKNLATWDGNSCSSSVKHSGDEFRNLIRDVDDCVANADPTGVSGLFTSETSAGGTPEIGFTPDEVEGVMEAATSDAALGADHALTGYLASKGGQAAIARNPAWAKVVRGLPVVKYLALAYSLAETCGSAMDFLMTGPSYLAQGQPVWKQRGGIWVKCTTRCVPDESLNYPGCVAVFVTDDPETLRQEMVCKPGTGEPPAPRPPSEKLRHDVCGDVATSDSDFDYDEYCDRQVASAVSACRSGTYAKAYLCPKLVPRSSPTTVTTTPASPGGTGGPGGGGVNAASVPGGGTSGTCAQLIQKVASSGSPAPYSSSVLASCLGTTDSGCYVIKAKAAAGHSVFPLASDVQRRCFG